MTFRRGHGYLVVARSRSATIAAGSAPALAPGQRCPTSWARRSTVTVDLDVGFRGRYDPTLEATVYYVVAESITNAAKHANASVVEVRGGRRGKMIELEITDDGVGGADPRRGSGLIGLKDRVDTLGGTISLSSPLGSGTTIRMQLPTTLRVDPDRTLGATDDAARVQRDR